MCPLLLHMHEESEDRISRMQVTMSHKHKIFYSVLLGGVLWAFTEMIFYFRIFSHEDVNDIFIIIFSSYLAFGAILFFIIKATKYNELLFLLFSIASYSLLRLISICINIIIVQDFQFDPFVLSISIKSVILEGITMLVSGALSGTIVIMINKKVLNKRLNKEATEKEKRTVQLNED